MEIGSVLGKRGASTLVLKGQIEPIIDSFYVEQLFVSCQLSNSGNQSPFQFCAAWCNHLVVCSGWGILLRSVIIHWDRVRRRHECDFVVAGFMVSNNRYAYCVPQASVATSVTAPLHIDRLTGDTMSTNVRKTDGGSTVTVRPLTVFAGVNKSRVSPALFITFARKTPPFRAGMNSADGEAVLAFDLFLRHTQISSKEATDG